MQAGEGGEEEKSAWHRDLLLIAVTPLCLASWTQAKIFNGHYWPDAVWLNLLYSASCLPFHRHCPFSSLSLQQLWLHSVCSKWLLGVERLSYSHYKHPTHMQEWGRKEKKRRNQEEEFHIYYNCHHHYYIILLQKWKRLLIICKCLGKGLLPVFCHRCFY